MLRLWHLRTIRNGNVHTKYSRGLIPLLRFQLQPYSDTTLSNNSNSNGNLSNSKENDVFGKSNDRHFARPDANSKPRNGKGNTNERHGYQINQRSRSNKWYGNERNTRNSATFRNSEQHRDRKPNWKEFSAELNDNGSFAKGKNSYTFTSDNNRSWRRFQKSRNNSDIVKVSGSQISTSRPQKRSIGQKIKSLKDTHRNNTDNGALDGLIKATSDHRYGKRGTFAKKLSTSLSSHEKADDSAALFYKETDDSENLERFASSKKRDMSKKWVRKKAGTKSSKQEDMTDRRGPRSLSFADNGKRKIFSKKSSPVKFQTDDDQTSFSTAPRSTLLPMKKATKYQIPDLSNAFNFPSLNNLFMPITKETRNQYFIYLCGIECQQLPLRRHRTDKQLLPVVEQNMNDTEPAVTGQHEA